MIRNHVRAALGAGIRAGDEDAARAALRTIDPAVRGIARRRLERALVDAALASDAAGLTQPPAEHVLRLAALMTVRRPVDDAANVEAVAAAYDQLPPVAMPRLPVWTILAALAALAVVGSIAFAIVTRPGPPSRTYVRPMPP